MIYWSGSQRERKRHLWRLSNNCPRSGIGEGSMAVREIIMIGDPILRQKAKKIHRFDPSLQKLANDMFETLHDAEGIGLAAPQIAQLIRLFVIEFDDKKTGKHYKVAMANPEIVKAE